MSAVNLKITPASEVAFRQGLAIQLNRVIHSATMALDQSADKAFSQVQVNTPRVTGALALSGKIHKNDTVHTLRRTIGFGDSTPNPRTGKSTSSYAVEVHEVYRASHPNSYKWLELAIRRYGRESFLHDLAASLKTVL